MDNGYHNTTADSAMTEVALALAMGFFSIMVLTMVSMGTGAPVKAADQAAAKVADAAVLQQSETRDNPSATVSAGAEDRIVIYYRGRFLSTDLVPLDPAALDGAGRMILALAPDLPMKEALQARARLRHGNLVVSTLDQNWLDTLERMAK